MTASDLCRLIRMYRVMLKIRLVEERIGELVEAGEIQCPCHLCIGQEAIATGVCDALRREDYVWGGHRSHGHYLAKGGDLGALMRELFGARAGCSQGRGGSMHLIATDVGILGTVPLVAATIPLAVGGALSAQLRGSDQVSVSFFGDGATEEGHFHESLNLAALYKLPAVFVCENNFYASHMPLLKRRAADNIVATADAHGIWGERLDGNDVQAVYRAASRAVLRAREGNGPTLMECRTYRWRGHVGPSWDMDVGLKRSDELREWLPRDPIARLQKELVGHGVDQEELDGLRHSLVEEIESAVSRAHQSPQPCKEDLLDHVYVSGGAGGAVSI